MQNFEFEYNGKKYWYSRSMTAVTYVFAYNHELKEWCILADQRGTGCPTCNGMWNVPCGYLDHNESIITIGSEFDIKNAKREGAALRELREETGVIINPKYLKFYSLYTLPKGKKQNMNCSFYAILPGDVNDYPTTDKFSEKDEVADIQWIPINKLSNYEFAFRQKPIIYDIYNKFINISWWRKMMLCLSDKLNNKYRGKFVF